MFAWIWVVLCQISLRTFPWGRGVTLRAPCHPTTRFEWEPGRTQGDAPTPGMQLFHPICRVSNTVTMLPMRHIANSNHNHQREERGHSDKVNQTFAFGSEALATA